METISIQGVDEQLSALLKQQAAKLRSSVKGELDQKEATWDDLDHLFGSWSEEEFTTIQGTISSARQIDPELWS